jgi:hypothetical protein
MRRRGQRYSTTFWIDSRKGTDDRFETFVPAWSRHNRNVQLPDNIFLMTYGLVSRYLGDGVVCWDDPHGLLYDVVRIKSHIDWDNKPNEPLSFISVRRDYLEDYCHLKQCAAVQVYYEGNYSPPAYHQPSSGTLSCGPSHCKVHNAPSKRLLVTLPDSRFHGNRDSQPRRSRCGPYSRGRRDA